MLLMSRKEKRFHNFEKGPQVLEYMKQKNMKLYKHTVKYLEVYKEDGTQLVYYTNNPLWVMLPKSIAKKTMYLKITVNGVLKAVTQDEQTLIISKEKLDDVLSPEICFLGGLTNN